MTCFNMSRDEAESLRRQFRPLDDQAFLKDRVIMYPLVVSTRLAWIIFRRAHGLLESELYGEKVLEREICLRGYERPVVLATTCLGKHS